MRLSDLPPGVNASDIPGNAPDATGVQEWLTPPDGRRDLFEFDDTGHWAFPCGECKNRFLPESDCAKCRHCAGQAGDDEP